MDERIERASRQFTSVALVAAALLIGLSYLGVGPSLLLAVFLFALGGILLVARIAITDVRYRVLTWHLETLWVGPVVAALAVVVWRTASAGELQAIGGLIGLVGMVNYLVRPVYAGIYWLASRIPGISQSTNR